VHHQPQFHAEAVEKLWRPTVKPKNQRKVLTRTASMVSRHPRKAFQATLASVLRRFAEDRGVFLHPRWTTSATLTATDTSEPYMNSTAPIFYLLRPLIFPAARAEGRDWRYAAAGSHFWSL